MNTIGIAASLIAVVVLFFVNLKMVYEFKDQFDIGVGFWPIRNRNVLQYEVTRQLNELTANYFRNPCSENAEDLVRARKAASWFWFDLTKFPPH